MEPATNRHHGGLADWCVWQEGDDTYHSDRDIPEGWIRHKRGNAEQRGLRACYTCYETKGGHDNG